MEKEEGEKKRGNVKGGRGEKEIKRRNRNRRRKAGRAAPPTRDVSPALLFLGA